MAFHDVLEELAPADRLRLLDQAREVEFAAGETIIEENTQHRAMYVILDGEVEVIRGAPTLADPERFVPLASLGVGNVFGEMSFLTGALTSASVSAKGAVRLLALEHHYLAVVMEKEPALAGAGWGAPGTVPGGGAPMPGT